jgi:hypothetical protein
MFLCACRWEVQSYGSENVFLLGKKLAEHYEEKIPLWFMAVDQVLFKISLSGKEKENIRDAYYLSDGIKRLGLMKNM